MAERGTTEVIRSLDPTITAWITEATPTNGSYEDLPAICDRNNLIIIVLTFIVCLFGLAGNASVIWFLGFKMHRNSFYTYILNLAVADFLFLCFHTTFLLLDVIEMLLPINISTHGILRIVTIFFYITDMNMISSVSIERCLSVLCPIWYHCHRPRYTSAVICALLWALSMFLSILYIGICFYINTPIDYCRKFQLTIAAWPVILFVVLPVSSLALMGRMLCGSQKKPLTRLYVTILLTVLVFLLCGLPFSVTVFLLWWMDIDSQALYCLYIVSTFLSCVNSSANPIIYFFIGSYRQGLQGQNLKLVLERALQDTPGKDESGGSLSQGTLEMSSSRVEQG